MSVHSQEARVAVLVYEGGKLTDEDLLAPCRWEALRAETDHVRFVDMLYGFFRRLEATAHWHRGLDHHAVREASVCAREILPKVREIQQSVEALTPGSPLEEAGKEFLQDRLAWAIGILEKSLPEWGY
ncbi:MAG: hypothetical protein G01um101438_759 [Parcubacteria group bacterium Gr01-1014_38]|nr:MAG: hypothetical protein G01um101438_759 [Parcubacteria group bacterium Gr01-1014_38]